MPQFTKEDVGKLFTANTADSFFNVKIIDDVYIEHAHGFVNITAGTPLFYLGLRQFKLSTGDRRFHVFLFGENTVACHEHLFAASSVPIVFEELTENGDPNGSVRNEGEKNPVLPLYVPVRAQEPPPKVEPKHPVVVRLFKFLHDRLVRGILG
jgi:hypothetical protein